MVSEKGGKEARLSSMQASPGKKGLGELKKSSPIDAWPLQKSKITRLAIVRECVYSVFVVAGRWWEERAEESSAGRFELALELPLNSNNLKRNFARNSE